MVTPGPADAVSRALARLAAGDRTAFDAVFGTVWPPVRGLCMKMLGNESDAEDAAQAALQKVFFQASDYDSTRPALPWILAIASWECATVKKRRLRRAEGSLDSVGEGASTQTPEQLVSEADLKASLESALGQLSEGDRAVLQAAFFEEVQRTSPAAPSERKRKERALKRLRDLWRTLHGD